MVLRLALAQKIGLGTPDHAVVATALPLVDGGPRRLVHGVLGTLLRRGLPPIDAPRLPEAVEERWREAWGEEVVEAARRQIAKRPPLDLTFADDAEAQAYADAHRGVSLAPRHVRIDSASVTELAGFGEGRWWVQDLAASLPGAADPGGREGRSRPLRRAGRQDDAAGRRRALRHGGRLAREVVSDDCAKICSARISTPSWSRPMRCVGTGAANSTPSCSMRHVRRPALSAAIPKSFIARGRVIIAESAELQASCSIARRDG